MQRRALSGRALCQPGRLRRCACNPAPVRGRRSAVPGDEGGTGTAPAGPSALVTFGRHDLVTSTRFAGPLTKGIAGSELIVLENCSHAPVYEDVDGFNRATLAFLQRHSG
jgi:pimeloyl-ACP methyl ester carboxylesterase